VSNFVGALAQTPRYVHQGFGTRVNRELARFVEDIRRGGHCRLDVMRSR
jgi:hypothetical protein